MHNVAKHKIKVHKSFFEKSKAKSCQMMPMEAREREAATDVAPSISTEAGVWGSLKTPGVHAKQSLLPWLKLTFTQP